MDAKTSPNFISLCQQSRTWIAGLLCVTLCSCASLNRVMYHGGTVPLYVSNDYTYYVDGKQLTVYNDVRSASVNTEDHYDYTVTTTTTTYSTALRLPVKNKYIAVERVDNEGHKTVFLCRRKPWYAYFWFDQFLTFDIGTIIDIADGYIYEWEIVASTDVKQ